MQHCSSSESTRKSITERNHILEITIHCPHCTNSSPTLYLLLRKTLLPVGAAEFAKELIVGQKWDAGFDVRAGNASLMIPSLANAALKLHFSDGPLFVAITVNRVGAFRRRRRPTHRSVGTLGHIGRLFLQTVQFNNKKSDRRCSLKKETICDNNVLHS